MYLLENIRRRAMSDKKPKIVFDENDMIIISAFVIASHPFIHTRYGVEEYVSNLEPEEEEITEYEKQFIEQLDMTIEKIKYFIERSERTRPHVLNVLRILGIEITDRELLSTLHEICVGPEAYSGEVVMDGSMPSPSTSIN